jgi:hypothetical protein
MSTPLDPQLARALIRSLTRGTSIRAGVNQIHVGHEKWLKAQEELLSEVSEDGHSDTKFVRGTYGAGKSHFLAVVQDRARSSGWATCHVECKVDGVQIDRFETLYPKIVAHLTVPNGASSDAEGADPIATHLLLDRWSQTLLQKSGAQPGSIRRPFDIESRLHGEFHAGLLRSSLHPDFTKALIAYVRARLSNDLDTVTAVAQWLSGSSQNVDIPLKYLRSPFGNAPAVSSSVSLRPIGRGTAREILRGLLWLIRSSGNKGLVLCIDEIEELSRLPDRRRQDQALQALREYVDDAGGDGGYRYLCMYLAATPEMFEGPRFFPRYDALQTRIEPVGPEVNWRAPVIDLDRTPLQMDELSEMARRILVVHRVAYPNSGVGFDESVLNRFVGAVEKNRFRVARPRLLARVVVDELERARQDPDNYVPPHDLAATLALTARRLTERSET